MKRPRLLEKQPDPVSANGIVVKSMFCPGCEEIKPVMEMYPGNPAICCDCDALRKHGRATPAEPGTTAVGQAGQFALFES